MDRKGSQGGGGAWEEREQLRRLGFRLTQRWQNSSRVTEARRGRLEFTVTEVLVSR